MDKRSQDIAALITKHEALFTDMSDRIWGFAEPRFQEYQSSELQQKVLADLGFSIRAGLAGQETAFIAEWGSGKPVIAILGEFDALSGLSQKADVTEHDPVEAGGQGHGCGHHLLGAGSAAAATAVKEYMEQNDIPGTIRYYGCPAEENAGGKAFLVRDGLFDDCDIAITWHPSTVNQVSLGSSLANFRVFYTFHGTSAHAAGSPHLGRSALDAVEIMNVGVNYMREHMISQARVHYAVTDSGGTAPNVVQSRAQVLYAIRAPKVTQVQELKRRIDNIAKGAALITETTVEIKQVSAYSDLITNKVIAARLDAHLRNFVPIDYTEEELEYARRFTAVTTQMDRDNLVGSIKKLLPKAEAERWLREPILNVVAPSVDMGAGGSTDVGDVSWVVPTAQLTTATWAPATAAHSWQATAQGCSSNAHKAMFAASKAMACAVLDFMTDPELVAAARAQWIEDLDGETYPNPLPEGYMPEIW
jgi:aminobenzoyl-glutamate utilization protein B